MKIIESKFEKKFAENNFLDFKDSKICFLDIETTGLSRQRDLIYLVGILHYLGNDLWNLKQILIEEENEERSLLEELLTSSLNFDTIINFNGDSFDIPFINSRLEKYSMTNRLPLNRSYDIYRIIRKNKFILPLDNLKLKTLEKSLNIFREDLYSGRECIDFFYEYLSSKSKSMESLILKHNYDDLYYLIDIMELLPRIKSKKTFKFEFKGDIYRVYMDSISLIGNKLNILGSLNLPLPENYISFDHDCKIEIVEKNFNFDLELKKLHLDEKNICHIVRLNNTRGILIYHNKDLNIRNLKVFLSNYLNYKLNNSLL